MRAQALRTHREEEEESAFVSMTDMTVGFLFIIMILLVFFASQVQNQNTDLVPRTELERAISERNAASELAEERRIEIERLEVEITSLRERLAETQARIAERDKTIERLEARIAELEELEGRPLERYLQQVATARRQILGQLRDALRADFPEIEVEATETALRFQGEGLFAPGARSLSPRRRQIVETLANRLDQILACYTIGETANFERSCNPDFAMVEAVQIEGHTDSDGAIAYNLGLSTDRATVTYLAMSENTPDVRAHQNLDGQPVLSVAAYGEDRPIATNETIEGRATNRRIDLRFIMVTPQNVEGIERIRRALEAGLVE